MRLVLIILVLAMLTMLALPVFAQDEGEIPPLFDQIFGAQFLTAVAAIIAATKIVRNLVQLKGWPALAITFVVSLAVAFYQYYAIMGIIYTALLGIVAFVCAAGLFKASKFVGYKVASG